MPTSYVGGMSESSKGEDSEASDGEEPSLADLRERVEETYDFEDFTPADMAEMTVDEWQAAFDPATWITGPELLDRVEAELQRRVADRQLFAVVERLDVDEEATVTAYSDEGYAIVAPDGSVRGEGMVLREVKPIVALCSMEDFDAGPMPEETGALLPDPEDVTVSTSSLGDRMVLAIAVSQLFAGVAVLTAPLVFDLGGTGGFLTFVVGIGFLVIGLLLGIVVANARLSGRFRAEEYRNRLRAAGVGTPERPSFLPLDESHGDIESDRSDVDETDTPDINGS